jgi:hypothetical protein
MAKMLGCWMRYEASWIGLCEAFNGVQYARVLDAEGWQFRYYR